MLTAPQVKEYARRAGADLVGIASMDRFEGAPKLVPDSWAGTPQVQGEMDRGAS